MKHLSLLFAFLIIVLTSCKKGPDENGFRTDAPYVLTGFSTGYSGCGDAVVTMKIKSNTSWDIEYTNSSGKLKILSVSPLRGNGNAQVKIHCGERPSYIFSLSNKLYVYYTGADGKRKSAYFWITSEN